MANSPNNSFLTSIYKLVEVILKSLGRSTTKRTWHQHVVPYEGDWAVKREGNVRITSKHRKQSTAVTKAKTLAKKYQADVIIHRENGEIRERISFKE